MQLDVYNPAGAYFSGATLTNLQAVTLEFANAEQNPTKTCRLNLPLIDAGVNVVNPGFLGRLSDGTTSAPVLWDPATGSNGQTNAISVSTCTLSAGSSGYVYGMGLKLLSLDARFVFAADFGPTLYMSALAIGATGSTGVQFLRTVSIANPPVVEPISAELNANQSLALRATGPAGATFTWTRQNNKGTLTLASSVVNQEVTFTAPAAVTQGESETISVCVSGTTNCTLVPVTFRAIGISFTSPNTSDLPANQTRVFNVGVAGLAAGASSSLNVTVLSGSGSVTGANGIYTYTPGAAGPVTIQARSVQDPTKTAAVSFRVVAVPGPTVLPLNPSVTVGRSIPLTATAAAGATFNWSKITGQGTLTSNGATASYMAPSVNEDAEIRVCATPGGCTDVVILVRGGGSTTGTVTIDPPSRVIEANPSPTAPHTGSFNVSVTSTGSWTAESLVPVPVSPAVQWLSTSASGSAGQSAASYTVRRNDEWGLGRSGVVRFNGGTGSAVHTVMQYPQGAYYNPNSGYTALVTQAEPQMTSGDQQFRQLIVDIAKLPAAFNSLTMEIGNPATMGNPGGTNCFIRLGFNGTATLYTGGWSTVSEGQIGAGSTLQSPQCSLNLGTTTLGALTTPDGMSYHLVADLALKQSEVGPGQKEVRITVKTPAGDAVAFTTGYWTIGSFSPPPTITPANQTTVTGQGVSLTAAVNGLSPTFAWSKVSGGGTLTANGATASYVSSIVETAQIQACASTGGCATATVVVNQGGVLSVNPVQQTILGDGEAKTFTVTTPSPWSAQSAVSWITVTSGAGNASGPGAYTVSRNNEWALGRSAVVRVSGVATADLTVNQYPQGQYYYPSSGYSALVTQSPASISSLDQQTVALDLDIANLPAAFNSLRLEIGTTANLGSPHATSCYINLSFADKRATLYTANWTTVAEGLFGSGTVLQSPQCSLDLANSTFTGTGPNYHLKAILALKATQMGAGQKEIRVTPRTSAGDAVAFTTGYWTLGPAALPIRLSAGGPAGYTDPAGGVWSSDFGFYDQGAVFGPVGTLVTGTTPAGTLVYQQCRFTNGTMKYRFQVNPGTYQVKLKFAEISPFETAGSRMFNVSINGSPVLTNFDIYSSAGGASKALDRVFNVPATGGLIEITFSAIAGKSSAIVNAIEITQ